MVVRQHLAAPPASVWRLIGEPDQMNRWSTAPIGLRSPGEGGRPHGVGAMRTVDLLGTSLLEVVRLSDPPHRLAYTVVGGVVGLRRHEGELVLEPTPDGGCDLTWTVDLEFAMPGPAALASRLVGRQLRTSVEAMAALRAPEPVPPTLTVVRPPTDQKPLRDAAEAVLAEQREIADRLAAADDAKQWFARVYQYVTEEQLAHLDRGGVDHPDWVLRLIPAFHTHYARNLAAFEAGGEPDPMWDRAWGLAERAGRTGSTVDIVKGLLLGVAAHIEADLVQALTAVHAEAFADRDHVVFRADYLRMAPVFTVASDRLMDDMPRSFVPLWLQGARRVLPAELRDPLMRRYYDVPRRRLEAFDRVSEGGVVE